MEGVCPRVPCRHQTFSAPPSRIAFCLIIAETAVTSGPSTDTQSSGVRADADPWNVCKGAFGRTGVALG